MGIIPARPPMPVEKLGMTLLGGLVAHGVCRLLEELPRLRETWNRWRLEAVAIGHIHELVDQGAAKLPDYMYAKGGTIEPYRPTPDQHRIHLTGYVPLSEDAIAAYRRRYGAENPHQN